MNLEEQIENAVRKQIEKDHNLGDHAGGSGHSSFVSFSIDKIESSRSENGKVEVKYSYRIIVESEFTYYPDNPPHESHYQKVLTLS